MNNESYIKLTLEIAKKGSGYVSPNPLVGAVIVKNNKIIGAGYHAKYGGKHAEINAIENAKESIEGSTMYVNLEPCSHFGKTPPCVDAIIKNKIKRVVIGTLDVNPLVSGKGVQKLKENGIDVKVGILEEECNELNKFFFKFMTKKIPFVTLKAAQTLDGKIADFQGYSKWISSRNSRRIVHEIRSRYDAVLIGSGTASADNPSLTVRHFEGRNPFRIVLDKDLSLKNSLDLFNKNDDKKLFLVTLSKNKEKKKKLKFFEEKNIDLIFTREDKNGRIDLNELLKKLGKLNITSVLIEGGSTIFSSFLQKSLFDDILLFISPKILGSGIDIASDIENRSLKKAIGLKIRNHEIIDDDILLHLTK